MYPDNIIERRSPPKGSTPNYPNIYPFEERGIKQKFYCRLTSDLCVGNPTDNELEGLLSYTKINECSDNPNRK